MSGGPLTDASHGTLGDAFRSIPEGKRGALLIVSDRSGARAVLAAKIGTRWQVAGEVDKPWTGPVTGAFTVQGAW